MTTAVTTITIDVDSAFMLSYLALHVGRLLAHVHSASSEQLFIVPSGNLFVAAFHVTGWFHMVAELQPLICPSAMHIVLPCEIVATFCIPPPKIVKITSAATRMTTAVTTIMMVVDSPFIHKLWWRSFKNLLGFPHQLIEAKP